MYCKGILQNSLILSPRVQMLLTSLREGNLTKPQLHSRRTYARKSNNVITALELAIAYEIFQIESSDV